MKRVTFIVAAIITGCLIFSANALAHDVQIVNAISSLEQEINDLERQIAELDARLNAGTVAWNQSAEVDDLYDIVDKLTEHLSAIGEHVKSGPNVPPANVTAD